MRRELISSPMHPRVCFGDSRGDRVVIPAGHARVTLVPSQS